MKIAFHTNEIGVRGTELATFKYAHYNEKILGNESIYIAGPPTSRFEHPLAAAKFGNRFHVRRYDQWSEIDSILQEEKVDVLYMQKGGEFDGKITRSVKTCVHAVFQNYDPHGDVYAYISEWLSLKMTQGSQSFVPYIVELPDVFDGIRAELEIPPEALVVGRTGGPDQFDIPFVHDVISRSLEERNDIYFLFLNTAKFVNHDRVIFLEPTADEDYKTRIVNSCDAMIHARRMGESFGLAIAEFSLRNKPVITAAGGHDQAHLHMLGPKALYYNDPQSLFNIFLNLKKGQFEDRDWNAYRQFSPAQVISKFNKVFLS